MDDRERGDERRGVGMEHGGMRRTRGAEADGQGRR